MNGIKSLDNIRPWNSIRKYFSNRAADRKARRERSNAEDDLHRKKCVYIDSLQLNLHNILNDDNLIIVNNDRKHGYNIILHKKEADIEPKSEYTNKNIIINIDARSLDDLTISIVDKYIGSPVKKFNVKNCEDYADVKEEIYSYIQYGQGSWILNKGQKE
jgi:hypothetical protein